MKTQINKTPQIDKILFAETKSRFEYPYQNWYFPLKRKCKKLISFDPRLNYIRYGRDGMNKRFLDLINREKPDYIFLWISRDRYTFETLLKIREVSPKTQVFLILQDEDSDFENYSRYYVLFADYSLILHKTYISRHLNEGNKNVFYSSGIDTSFFKNLNIEKKYDVSFIGCPKTKATGRYELIKFLKDNGVKIKIFGWGWDKYPEFKDIYGGVLDSDKMVEVVNQSKIHLNPTRNGYGKCTDIKAKIFEAGACKTFVLTEYFEDYKNLFKQGKELVMFKDKEELLKQVNYYLKHEDEREKIAENAYNKILNVYGLDVELDKIFKEIHNKNKKLNHKPLPKINKNIFKLSKNDFNLRLECLKNKLKDYDYIYFLKEKSKNLKYRTYLQSYSLEKSGKPISICDYNIYNKNLGDYLHFYAKLIFELENKELFESALDINQIMVTKDYFFNNIDLFKKIYQKDRKINFFNKEDIVFVSYPLVRIKKIHIKNYNFMKKVFEFRFLYDLYSLKYRKKLFSKPYIYFLILEILKGKLFILKSIIETLKNKERKSRLQALE